MTLLIVTLHLEGSRRRGSEVIRTAITSIIHCNDKWAKMISTTINQQNQSAKNYDMSPAGCQVKGI